MWKFNGKRVKREQWLLLLLAGAALLLLAMPEGSREGEGTLYDAGSPENSGNQKQLKNETGGPADFGDGTYADSLEEQVKEILKNVEGVGQVDVMIALKSTGESVLQTDRSTSSSSTKEQDSSGGSREIVQSDAAETTVLTGTGDGNGPIIQKKLYPEISGMVISASGGGSPQIKAEISEAMEALFGLPAHKIKVLKRVE